MMMKYKIAMIMFFTMVGTAWGTMWLYDDPSFFHLGSPFYASAFVPGNVSPLDIINAPYFPLLGQGFYADAIPVKISNSTNMIEIRSKGSVQTPPPFMTFGGHLENNLKYAQSKSSLRVGQGGTWNTLRSPGVI
jgi:hypothetical protein